MPLRREGIAPLEVSFTNTSTGDITTYLWDFGDTITSTAKNPTHMYTADGVYTISFTVDGPGGLDTEVKTNYITVYKTVQAGFYALPTEGIVLWKCPSRIPPQETLPPICGTSEMGSPVPQKIRRICILRTVSIQFH